MSLRALAPALVLGAVLGAAPAYAQPRQTDPKDQRAKDLFAKGDSAYAEGRYEEALASFQEAYTLSGRPQLLFNVSNALERLGRYAEAVDALDRYLASGKAKDRDVVQKRLANLKKRVEEQKKEQERLTKEDEDKRAKADAEKKKPDDQPTPPPPAPPPPEKSNTPIAPIVLVGVGGAALVAGGVFGILTLGARGDVKDGCKDTSAGHLCSSDVSSSIDKEKTFGIVADVAFASGIVLVGIGVYLFVTSGDPSKAKGYLNAPVKLAGGPTPGGLSFVGSF